MVKSTVRFPKAVIKGIEETVEEKKFSSKSEFQRFAVEYMLSEITDHDPEIVDFDEIRADLFPDESHIQEVEVAANSSDEFIETAMRVRQFAVRGQIDTAEEYIDTNYPPTDPRSVLLDDLLAPYRSDADSDE